MRINNFDIDFLLAHDWEYNPKKGFRYSLNGEWVSFNEAMQELLLNASVRNNYETLKAMDSKSSALYEEYLDGNDD